MEIELHPTQSQVYSDIFLEKQKRFFAVVCSRGWGKSYLGATTAVSAVHELMMLPPWVPNKRVYIVAPTHDDVTEIYYDIINYDLGMEHVALRSSRDRGKFTFPHNVTLHLVSYESVSRIRGKGVYFLVWDEISECYKKRHPRSVWEGIIEPAMRTRWGKQRAKQYGAPMPARALFIGTPRGYNFLYTLFNKRESNDEWQSYKFDYTTSPYLDPSEIEELRAELDPIEFASEYGANFEDSGYNLFYCFDRKAHVKPELEDLKKDEDVHFCMDFNVGIQATSVFALRAGRMEFLHEFKGHPDTETLAINLAERFKGHKLYAYPDPTGSANKTSAKMGATDHSILKDHGFIVRARKRSPPLVDSTAAVNRKLKKANGQMEMFFHPRVKGLIESVERTKWLDRDLDSATIDKSENIEHFSDGVRYATEWLFPIAHSKHSTAQGDEF